MLSRKHRFHGYGSLRRVYASSQNLRGSLVSLKFSPRRNDQAYRVAVVVGRKVNKSAVKRNRIRRRIYEIIRKSENVPSSTNLIFTVYSDQIINLPSQELENQINQLLVKAKKT